MSTTGDFRSVEQEKNIDDVCMLSPDKLRKYSIYEPTDQLMESLNALCDDELDGYSFIPGNKVALSYIMDIIKTNSNN